jgi:hypothetical protein
MNSDINFFILPLVAVLILVLILGIPPLMQEFREQSPIKDELGPVDSLNCTDLKDYFENGRNCSGVSPHQFCRYPKTISQSILYMMILKNCTGSGYLYWK